MPTLHAITPRRRRAPDPNGAVLAFYGAIAASGFAFGWAAQALGF